MKRDAQAVRILLVTALIFSGAGTRFVSAAEAVAQLNTSLYLGKPVVAENVTVWPVYSAKPRVAVAEYVTLPQAEGKRWAVVRETGATPQADGRAEVGGQVNQLVIENKGEKTILVLAGTLLRGGKQDRQIAQDFIIPPGQTVPVGAFCVEHGRWTAYRDGVANGGNFTSQNVLAQKEVRDKAQYKDNQQEVWKFVAQVNASNLKNPATGTLLESVEKPDAEAQARRERLKKPLAEKFAELAKEPDAPLGLGYAVDGKIREIRTFAHAKIHELYLDMLLNTVALEGEQAQRKAAAANQPVFNQVAEAQQAVELVKNAGQLQEEIKEFQNNYNYYRKSDQVWSAKCLSKADPVPVTGSWQPAE